MNLNLHPSDDFPCHRFFNAVEPESYIRPHRHLDRVKEETLVVIRGRIGVVSFDDTGKIVATALLEAGGDAAVADFPPGEYHCAVSLAPGSVFLEAKAGPFVPVSEEEKAPWAPAEGTAEAETYVENIRRLFA